MASSSFVDKAVTMITKTIPDLLLVHNLKRFQNYFFSSSSSSKQTVDDFQTKTVPPVNIVEPISGSSFPSSDQGDNNHINDDHDSVTYHTHESPSGADGHDHPISIPPSSVLLSLSLPENIILPLVQNLNNTSNLDGERNVYLLVLNDHHQQNPNPRLSVIQKYELGKMVFGVVAPLTMGLLTVIRNYSSPSMPPLPRLMVLFVVYTLSFGSAFIWSGILLRDMLPRAARGLEELGISMVFLAFFALLTSILPHDLVWAACLCYLLIVLPIVVLWFHDAS